MSEGHLHIYDGEPVEEFKGKPGWRDIPQGAVILDAGNAANYHTGDWRTEKAIWIKEKCTQ